jgi:predicted transcriptional regulator
VTTDLPLAAVQMHERTQVRIMIRDRVVAEYAAQMAAGAVFPPITVFLDEAGTYYLADGFHRFLAAQRNEQFTIAADVHQGTRLDALWFALGANRTHGQRLSKQDKSHAVKLALEAWPERMQRDIAAQVGCSTSLVSKVVMDSVNAISGLRGRALVAHLKREAIRERVLAGEQSITIAKDLHAHADMIAEVRRELGVSTTDYSRAGTQARRDRMRQLAAEGHTSRQIAAELGLTEHRVRAYLRKQRIAVPGDVVTHGTRHLNSTRIMARIVADAEDLAAGANLIDFTTLDHTQFDDWITTLQHARHTLGTFIKRLMQEKSHGEAA